MDIYQGITKGSSFNAYIKITSGSTIGPWKLGISKDAGGLVVPVNIPEAISNDTGLSANLVQQNFKLVLTASEMNADAIVLTGFVRNATDTGNLGDPISILILTGTSSGGGSGISMDDVIDNSDATPKVNPTLGGLFALLSRRLKRSNQKL